MKSIRFARVLLQEMLYFHPKDGHLLQHARKLKSKPRICSLVITGL